MIWFFGILLVLVGIAFGVALWIGRMLYAATIRILSDQPSEELLRKNPMHGVFVPAISEGEPDFPFISRTARLHDCPLLLNGNKKGMDRSGYQRQVWEGSDKWKETLDFLGIAQRIMLLPPGYDTYDENSHLLRWSKERRHRNYHRRLQDDEYVKVLLISSPNRALRLMLTFLKTQRDLGIQSVDVWIAVPVEMDWYKVVHGSQGKQHAEFWKHILPELWKILWPHRGQWLLPILPVLFRYWDERHARYNKKGT